MTEPMAQPRLDEARPIETRLITWANARDRRNPNGHGKTGTKLLRDAASALRVERERAERLERELLPAVKAVLDNGVLVEGGVLIADTGAATDLQIVYAAALAEQERDSKSESSHTSEGKSP